MEQKTSCEMAISGLVKVKAGEERMGLQGEVSYLSSRMWRKPSRNEFTGACRIIHHIRWLYPHVEEEIHEAFSGLLRLPIARVISATVVSLHP